MNPEENVIKIEGGRNKIGRIAGLDILRISLAILIYMFHSRMHFGCSYSYLNDFVSVGALAMTGFFMLSGYSLCLVYGKKNLTEKKQLLMFYVKRMVSILPLYYFTALIYVLLIGEESWLDNLFLFPIELLGLQSTFSSLFGITHNSGTWFISCLLLAYLAYPLMQTICKYLNKKSKVILLCILIFIDIWGAFVGHRFNTASLYDNPFYRIIEVYMGLLVADINLNYNTRYLKILRNRWLLVSAVIVLIISVSIINHCMHIQDEMLLNIIVVPSFVIMLIALGQLLPTQFKWNGIICYLGQISFAFFLSQYYAWSAGRWFVDVIGYNSNVIRIAFTFSFCVLISIAMYEFIQKPIRKIMSKIIDSYE